MFSLLKLRGVSVEITLVNDRFMRAQNKKFMHKRETTDVLSFPQVPVAKRDAGMPRLFNGKFLGDILVSLDQAKRQGAAQGISLKKEVLFLILHAILHLLGHDHAGKKERLAMQREESRVWRKICLT